MSIVVCYDGSASAKSAIAKVAAVMGSEHAVVLNVWSAPEAVHADSFGSEGVGGPSFADLQAQSRERARDIAEEGRQLAHDLGLGAEAREQSSDQSIWQTIIEVADREDARLIVLGTRGSTAVQQSLGSVSGALAAHSRRAVLIVPAGDPD